MKVRMKVQISGTHDGADWPAIDGELVVSDQEGADLCSQGHAVPVVDVKPERATAPAPEKRARVRPVAR